MMPSKIFPLKTFEALKEANAI